MARIKYQLTTLNPGNIVSGSLCVVTRKYNGNSYPYDPSPTANNYIYNTVGRSASQPGSEGNSQYFLGAGICNYKTPYYYISVNSVTYTFDAAGKPISSNAANYTLYSAVILNRTIAVGTVIPTNTDATQNLSVSENGATRGSIPDSGSSTSSPETSIVYDDDAKKVVAINQLNARDEFAAAALRGMLNHIDDPSTMSKNEMFYLCDTSYKWAENMMTAAANARAGYSAQGYNTDPMNSLIDAVDRDSQLEFTVAAGDGITVNSGQSASYPGNSTFNLALSSSYLTNFLSSWKTTNQILNWGSLTNSGAEKIDASHLPNGTLTWSDLINAGNSEKINNAHLDISSSNNVANKIPITNSSGVMEVGTYMDFHDLRENNTNATDYNTRLQIGNPSLNNGKGNTVTLPNNSGTLALVENTVSTSTTWWGRSISNGKVEGDIKNARHIYMSGNLDIVGQSGTPFSIGYSDFTSSQTPPYRTLLGVHSLEHSDPALYIGYGLRYDKRLELHGRKIQFTIQKSTATDYTEDASTAMTILGRESAGKEGYVGIGISDPTSMLHVAGAVRIGNILLTSEGDNTLKISKFDGTAANMYATGGVSSIMQNASINSDKKFYFDSTHYLHVDNGVLKYFNGSTDKTVNLT